MFKIIRDLWWVCYPDLCAACEAPLEQNEKVICFRCIYHLPRTNDHLEHDNHVARLFWGRTVIENAISFLHFGKGEKVQRLMHQLKYKGRQDIGIFTGKVFATEFLQNEKFKNVDYIIPVPLHPSKLRQRGYNQSKCIADGIAEVLEKPVLTDVLIKNKASETQTRRQRYQRALNVDSVFKISGSTNVKGKHILLVDDVVTTGATLVSCSETLHECGNVQVSIATLAST